MTTGEIRVRVGDLIEARLTNHLPAGTTVHWHGLALRNDMDGAPDVTQPPVQPGQTFTYRFVAENPGTYWFHPHTGVQHDRGLYAPLIVEDPAEPGAYDKEWTVVLDDWIDGTGTTPDQVLAGLRKGMTGMGGMGGMDMGWMLMVATSKLLGGDAGDVKHPHYLINGRAPAFRARPGERVRIRIINAGSDTAFRVALGGHRMRVTHTDGFPVVPVEADALLIGMGERYEASGFRARDPTGLAPRRHRHLRTTLRRAAPPCPRGLGTAQRFRRSAARSLDARIKS